MLDQMKSAGEVESEGAVSLVQCVTDLCLQPITLENYQRPFVRIGSLLTETGDKMDIQWQVDP